MARADHRLVRPFIVIALVAAATLLAACGSGVQENEVSATVPAPDLTTPPTDDAEPGDTAITSTTEADTTDTTDGATTDTSVGPGDVPAAEAPGDLGDDDELDALAEDCFDGDFSACDRLFFESDVDSAYEAYGDSCGGRNDPAGLCVAIYGRG